MCAGKFRRVGGGILEFSVAMVAVEESAVAAMVVVAAVAAVAVATVVVAVAGGCNCYLL